MPCVICFFIIKSLLFIHTHNLISKQKNDELRGDISEELVKVVNPSIHTSIHNKQARFMSFFIEKIVSTRFWSHKIP